MLKSWAKANENPDTMDTDTEWSWDGNPPPSNRSDRPGMMIQHFKDLQCCHQQCHWLTAQVLYNVWSSYIRKVRCRVWRGIRDWVVGGDNVGSGRGSAVAGANESDGRSSLAWLVVRASLGSLKAKAKAKGMQPCVAALGIECKKDSALWSSCGNVRQSWCHFAALLFPLHLREQLLKEVEGGTHRISQGPGPCQFKL